MGEAALLSDIRTYEMLIYVQHITATKLIAGYDLALLLNSLILRSVISSHPVIPEGLVAMNVHPTARLTKIPCNYYRLCFASAAPWANLKHEVTGTAMAHG